ncbi:MAG: EpsI family protein [Gammaproteobacteria bacterium]|nr:EpsI family protein [Gammaproteobacteria bacterium]
MTAVAPSDGLGVRRYALVLLLFSLIAAWGALYGETLGSMVGVWRASTTYHHCFLIVPIAVFLAWNARFRLGAVDFRPYWAGVVILLGLSLVWWASVLVGVQTAEHLSAVLVIPALVLAVLGPSAAREVRFPLFYLVFAVPFGEVLLPYLVDFTAGFAVDSLRLLGIPVIQDGRYFQIPTGNYEVAEACGGLKYLVATMALATLYAHVLFSGVMKQALFVGFALSLSILANGVRATLVVLLLHHTDLDIASGKDHEFVGWITFGVMLLVLIWFGKRYQDEGTSARLPLSEPADAFTSRRSLYADTLIVTAAVIACGVGPIAASRNPVGIAGSSEAFRNLPAAIQDWQRVPADTDWWRPGYVGYSSLSQGRYSRGGEIVDIALVEYRTLRQGAEVTSSTNSVADPRYWAMGSESLRILSGSQDEIPVSESIIVRGSEQRLVWRWVEVNGSPVRGVLATKLAELRNIYSKAGGGTVAIVLSSPVANGIDESIFTLTEFSNVVIPHLRNCAGDRSGASNSREGC